MTDDEIHMTPEQYEAGLKADADRVAADLGISRPSPLAMPKRKRGKK